MNSCVPVNVPIPGTGNPPLCEPEPRCFYCKRKVTTGVMRQECTAPRAQKGVVVGKIIGEVTLSDLDLSL